MEAGSPGTGAGKRRLSSIKIKNKKSCRGVSAISPAYPGDAGTARRLFSNMFNQQFYEGAQARCSDDGKHVKYLSWSSHWDSPPR